MYTKKRNIILNVLLSLITCGIWYLVFIYQVVEDVNEATFKELNYESQINGIIYIILSIFTLGIYGYIWTYKMSNRLDDIREKKGLHRKNEAVLHVVCRIFSLGIVSYAILQNTLNEIADINNNTLNAE